MFIYFISAWLSRLSSANPYHLITKTKFFYTHNVYKCLLLSSWGNFSIFWGKIHGGTYGKKKDKVISKWCSPCAHLRHLCVSLWSKSASFIQLKIKHTSIFPLPVNAEACLGHSGWDGILVFGNTEESPGLPWEPALQRSAVTSPSEIGIRLKQGVCPPGPYQRRVLRGGDSGVLDNSRSSNTGTCLQRAFQMAAPKDSCFAYWPNLIFWGWGCPSFSSPGQKDKGLHAGLLLMWVFTFVTDVYLEIFIILI